MALYPGARHRLIPAGTNDPPITVIGAILHVDAGNSKSLYGYFSEKSDGIESHFHIPKEGAPEQYRDTGREADANLKANSFVVNGKRYGFVSIETQGYGSGEWNAHQLQEIKELLLWLSDTHNFSLRRCPDWNQSGVGYHTMWGAPSQWTPVAKSCPGPDRIEQFNDVLVPWMAQAHHGTPTPPKEDLTMADAAELKAQAAKNAELAGRRWAQTQDALTEHDSKEDGRYAELHTIHEKVDQLTANQIALGQKLDEVLSALGGAS